LGGYKMDYKKNKNGSRMKITIELFHNNPKINEHKILEEIIKRSREVIKDDTAGCIKTTLDLLKNKTIKIQDNLKVNVPAVDNALLKNLKSQKELGWILTAEMLNSGGKTDHEISELAKKYKVDYNVNSKKCIHAGVRYLFSESLIEYTTENE